MKNQCMLLIPLYFVCIAWFVWSRYQSYRVPLPSPVTTTFRISKSCAQTAGHCSGKECHLFMKVTQTESTERQTRVSVCSHGFLCVRNFSFFLAPSASYLDFLPDCQHWRPMEALDPLQIQCPWIDSLSASQFRKVRNFKLSPYNKPLDCTSCITIFLPCLNPKEYTLLYFFL